MELTRALPIYARVLVRMIYPEVCPICSNSLRSWESKICQSCWQTLCELKKPQCPLCGGELPLFSNLRLCQSCRGRRHFVDHAWSLYAYNESLRKIFHLIKFKQKCSLLRVFRPEIQRFVEETSLPRLDSLVPVPLDRKKKWERGFNQSAILAQMLAISLHSPMIQVLRKRALTPPQSLLTKTDRLRNILNSFSAASPDLLRHKDILLVDDIYTTGATVNECARILKENGARTVSVFTLARTCPNWN